MGFDDVRFEGLPPITELIANKGIVGVAKILLGRGFSVQEVIRTLQQYSSNPNIPQMVMNALPRFGSEHVDTATHALNEHSDTIWEHVHTAFEHLVDIFS